MSRWGWSPYVPVAVRKAKALKQMDKLRKKGMAIQPIKIEGRTIAKSFWGKSWCLHLESFSDYENRLPRGRTYVRNGSVCHLDMSRGKISAIVCGSDMYKIAIDIKQIDNAKWENIKKKCSGQIGSILELLRGKLSTQVMGIVTEQKNGLFPHPTEISLSCSCPDWAIMCKHVAAVLYGVGSRLDEDPSLLFLLRGVDPQELISSGVAISIESADKTNQLDEASLSDIFGIDLDDAMKQQDPVEGKIHHAENVKARKLIKSGGKGTITKAKAPSLPEPKPVTKSPQRAFVPMGARIANLRKKTGLTAAEFAGRVGVSAASLYRWENTKGKVNLKSQYLAVLQAIYESLQGT